MGKASDTLTELLARLGKEQTLFRTTLGHLGLNANAVLFLSQAIYWNDKQANSGKAWFYKTVYEWKKETWLTEREQESARRVLREKGYISEVRRGIPCKLYFKVNLETIERDAQKATSVPRFCLH